IASYSLVHESGVQDRLYPAPLEPVMRENYAFVQRRGAQLSRGARVIKENLKMVLDTLPIDAPEASERIPSPPESTLARPDMKAPVSDPRSSTHAAISSGCAARPSGME